MARITVEDCIDKFESRFELVLVASNRARKLHSGESPTVEKDNDKPTVIALREIADESVSVDTLKDKLIEVNTIFKFEDKEEGKKKSYFEMVFATIIKISDEIKEKEKLEKIILCDVQVDIYSDLEKSLLDLIHNSGYPEIKFEKKINFEELYNKRLN